MNSLGVKQALETLNQLRKELGIPENAKMQFIEKRYIELTGADKIEPLAPLSNESDGVVKDEEVELENVVEPAVDEESGSDIGDSGITQKLVWVGKYIYGYMFWELSIDQQGTLVRIKKAR